MDYLGLGRRIKTARRAKGMTQEDLAKRVGISLSFLGHIERGSRKASMETLVKLSNALAEPLDQLLRDSLIIMPDAPAAPPPMQVLHTLRSPQPNEEARKRDDPFDIDQEQAKLIKSMHVYLGLPIDDDPLDDWDN